MPSKTFPLKPLKRKGIVLAGGAGTRLYPATQVVSKQLMPVFDKPMIYYPLSVLMLANIQDILIITTPHEQHLFKALLGDGAQWGVSFTYATQDKPNGLAEALLIGESFLNGHPSTLVLGDNIFYGHQLPQLLCTATKRQKGATVFTSHVKDPSRFGIADINAQGHVVHIEEKPAKPRSHQAVTGLYCYDATAPEKAKAIKPSARGELEITCLNNMYLEEGALFAEMLGRGYAWLDSGTHESLLEASHFIHTLQERQGMPVACLEEIAYKKGWITDTHLEKAVRTYHKTAYGQFLQTLLNEESNADAKNHPSSRRFATS